MKILLLKTWRDIWVRKTQFLALIVLLALGIASYVAFMTSYESLSASADRSTEDLKLADFTVKVASAPRDVVGRVEKIDGVRAVEGRLIIDTGLDLSADEQAQARIIGVPAGRRPKVDDLLVLDGAYPQKGSREALLHNKFAKEAGLSVGDTLTVRSDGEKLKVKVAGIASSPEYFFPRRAKVDFPAPKEFAVLWIEQAQVEKMFNRPASVSDIAVLVDEPADRKRVIKETEKILQPYQVLETVKQEDQPSNFGMREEIRQNQEIAGLMPVLILGVAFLTLFIALSRLVQSQRGEIGLSKALGYKDWQILVHYLSFSLFIAVVGSALGFALGTYLGRWLTQMYIDMLNIPILEHQIYPQVVVGAVSLGLVTCVLAGAVPALTSARLLPAQAMRFDPSIALSKGRVSLIERLFGWMLPSSFSFRIPLRNVFRVRRRSLYTILGIVFALILTVSTWSMFDSIGYMLDSVFSTVWKYDIIAVFRKPLLPSRLDEVARFEGVNDVNGALLVPARFEANGKRRDGAVTAIKPRTDFYGFNITEGEKPKDALEKHGLIVPKKLAEKLELRLGDSVEIKTPYIQRPVFVQVRAINDEMWGSSVFVGIEEGKALAGSPVEVYNAFYLDVAQGESKSVKKKLYALPGAATVQVKGDLMKMMEDYMGLIYIFEAVLFAFAFTVGFVVLYNTFTANVIERTREIATMMTIGEDRRHLAWMVTLENVLLALVGVPIGIYLGYLTAQLLYGSLSTEVYTLKAILYPQSYIWIVLSILGILLLSELPPIRRIFRLNLAEATKVME